MINIPAIMIANLMGVAILFTVVVTKYVGKKNDSKENTIINIMIILALISCIADPICFIADGREGLIFRILVYVCNTWIFVGNILISAFWVFLVSTHFNFRVLHSHIIFVLGICFVSFVIMIVNFFTPFVFSVNESNIYQRETIGYWLMTALNLAVIVDGTLLYVYAKFKSKNLKFFPIIAFLIPAIIGAVIQAMNYGISTVVPFTTVSIACMVSCLQSEYIFIDQLTGLYNRVFLIELERKFVKRSLSNYTAMMIDINGFKKINDNFGHKNGDKALIETANILTSVIQENGAVARYAGDEFIIVLNTQNDFDIQNTIQSINESVDYFNQTSGNQYKLSLSIGHCKLSNNEASLDKFLDKIDKLMYEDKREFYKQNPEMSKRKEDFDSFEFEDENEDCKIILDSFRECALYVIDEKTHEILYFNKKFKELNPQAKLGFKCGELLGVYCKYCQVSKLNEKVLTCRGIQTNSKGEQTESVATKLIWRNKTSAILIALFPHIQN